MSLKPKSPPQIKFFISNADTLIGQAIIEQVRNDHLNDKNPHIIQGTKSDKNVGPMPKAVKIVVNNRDVRSLTKTLIESDVIVYDLSTAKLDEVEYAIKVLRMANYETEKTLVIISSVMVWSNTPPKERTAGEIDDEELSELQLQSGFPEDFSQNEASYFEDITKGYVPYREKDFAKRRPSSKYEIYKSIETQCLNAGAARKNLSAYVLCSGVLYGNGEDVFASYFKQAWLQKPEALSYIGDGSNVIPTIHVKDLATYVAFVINRKPPTKYLFAIDHTRNPTLKSHVETVAKSLGTGKMQSITIMEAIHEPYLDILKLNIRLQPSKLVDQLSAEDETEVGSTLDDNFDEERNTGSRFKFTWWCKEGLKKNIGKVIDEFNTYRGLKPLKIFLTGPPASGKTFFGSRLADVYNVPHVNVKDVVREVSELQNELGEEVRTILAQIKEKMIADAQAQADLLNKKKKKGQPDIIVDPDTIIPRLPEPLLYKGFRHVLGKADCYNRGYILDGFPRTYEDAKGVFFHEPAPKLVPTSNTEVPAEPEIPVPQELDWKKMPEFIIKFEAADEFLKAKVKALPEEHVTGTHFTEEGMNRRLPLYAKHNLPDTGVPTLLSFFEEKNPEGEEAKILVMKIKLEEHPGDEAYNKIRGFIEKDGKVKNFQDAEEIAEQKRKKRAREEQEQERKAREAARREEEERESKERKEREEKEHSKLEAIKEAEKKLLDERSQPLRQYLADLVVPYLTSGIIDICKDKPDDPVKYLSDFLYKKTAEMKQNNGNNVDRP